MKFCGGQSEVAKKNSVAHLLATEFSLFAVKFLHTASGFARVNFSLSISNPSLAPLRRKLHFRGSENFTFRGSPKRVKRALGQKTSLSLCENFTHAVNFTLPSAKLHLRGSENFVSRERNLHFVLDVLRLERREGAISRYV